MVKTYLRYTSSYVFGLVSSGSVDFSHTHQENTVVTSANEYLIEWNIRTQTKLKQLKDGEHNHTLEILVASPNSPHYVAAGYSDGSIKIWDLAASKCVVTLNGHKTGITSLRFNSVGSLLASGSRDTTVIVWDIVAETGLYKLKGHKDMITDCVFLEKQNKLITSSKDALIKIWDLETQHCVQTIVNHREEVWAIDINPQQTRLVSGSVDNFLRFWSLDPEEWSSISSSTSDMEIQDADEPVAKYYGNIERKSRERVSKIRYNHDGTLLAVQATDHTLEIYELRSKDQIQKKLKKRKMKEKKRKDLLAETDPEAAKEFSDVVSQLPVDEYNFGQIISASHKIKSFAFSHNSTQVALALINNSIEVYKIEEPSKSSKQNTVELAGHRADVRELVLNSDNSLLLSTSKDQIKLWNVNTRNCLKTIPSGYGLSAVFVPGNNHVIIGTKTGHLEIYDLTSSLLVESIQAHSGGIWSLDVKPDKTGIVSGSADKSVKFWDFDLVSTEDKKSKRLSLSCSKTLTMSDDVLCVRYSPDSKFIAIALLDCTVKIFYEDSLKFYLSLYGHKLPVMSLSISSDSTLIVTASADKNVKIWGMDFGDCHKSIYGHEDSIMQVRFVPNTHYFWTCSKDKLIKHWDADKFEMIQSLSGHQGAIWGLAVSSNGSFVVTCGQDKSIRIWERTDEQLFLDEERERALESMFENQDNKETGNKFETDKATKSTMESLKASERLIEAIELADEFQQSLEAYNQIPAEDREEAEPPKPSPLFLGLSPSDYVLKVLRDIKSNDLDEALLVLPFNLVLKLLHYMNDWVTNGKYVELSCRCIFFLIKIHHNQITTNTQIVPLLESLRGNTRAKLQEFKDVIGFNRSAMRYLKRSIENNTNSYFFEDSILKTKEKKAKKQ